MRKFGIKRAVLGAAVAAMAMSASAAQAATATGTATAQILRQITLTSASPLEFATIVSGSTASTVTVSTAGARTCGNGLSCLGTASAASFNIDGTNGAVVVVGGDSSVTLNASGGTMTAALSYSAPTVTLGATGGNFQVGGVLNVGANQAAGAYTGTFTVTANYQ